MRCVWAYKKLNELNGELGFVDVERVLAGKLLKAKAVQDPYEGAITLKFEDPTIPISDGVVTAPTNPTTTTNPVKPVKPKTTPAPAPQADEPKKKKKKKSK